MPYTLHPWRVMFRLPADAARIASALNDVVENIDVILKQLRYPGFSHAIVDAIYCHSKRSDESYDAFVARVGSDVLATPLKIQDNTDNLDLTRLQIIEADDL